MTMYLQSSSEGYAVHSLALCMQLLASALFSESLPLYPPQLHLNFLSLYPFFLLLYPYPTSLFYIFSYSLFLFITVLLSTISLSLSPVLLLSFSFSFFPLSLSLTHRHHAKLNWCTCRNGARNGHQYVTAALSVHS